MRRTMIFKSRWGWMGVVEAEKGIATIVLPKASRMMVAVDVRRGSRGQSEEGSSPRLRTARKQLTEYLAGRRTSFTLPLDLSEGTGFQRRVWRALQNISYGHLHSYQELGARVGGPQYARAVGNAVGANPLPIVIPCHRIVSQDGSLGGFSGGLLAKRRLLALEGSLSRICRRGRTS